MAALLGGMAWCAQHGAAAQPAAPAAEQGAQMRFSIPAGPLDQALTGFAAASGIQLLYDSGLTHGRRSPGVSGALPPREALRRLLAGSGLEGQFTSPQAVMLRPAPQQGSAADGSLVLPEVNVTAGLQQRSWQPVRGYVADVAATATKTDTPILETPQSISVVTRDQMDDQQVQNVGQALRYTAGLEGEYLGAYGSNDEAYSRGFAMDYYLDGMRVLHNAGPGAGTQIESFNLERIEVLRGPSSVLYGAGSPAGIINLVSRRPSDQAGGEVRLQAGSYDRLLGGFTSTGPLNEDKTLLYRMTGVGWQGGTQVDGSRQQRLSISPALTWRPDDRTSWTIIGQYAYDPEGGLYSYIPASGTILPNPNGTLDLRRNYGDQN
ncbi:MAG: TonB-dependent receptor plug domain-containing protein, partial [Paracraurococcus sp.]